MRLLRSIRRFLGRHPVYLGALGVLALWLLYNSSARFVGGSDVYPSRFIPVSLVTEGDYDLDEFRFIRGEGGEGGIPGGQYFTGEEGKPYNNRVLSYYPTLVPTLLAPFYLIPFRFMGLSPEHFLVFYMDRGFASLFCAFSALFLFLSLREVKTPPGMAFLLVVAYALATSTWAISAQSLWQHGPSQGFLTLSLWLWLRSGRTGGGYLWLGLAVGCAVGARPSNAIWAMLLIVDLLARRRWRGFAWYVLGGMPAFLFLCSYNWVYFGAPWHSGYELNPVQRFVPEWLALRNLPAGGLGLVFSPSLGLVPNAPFFAILPLAIWIGMRRPLLRGARPIDASRRWLAGFARWIALRRPILLPLTFVIASLVLYGSYREWWAGWSFCYRYLTDSLPFLCFLFHPLWRMRLRRGWRWPNRFMRATVWLAFLAGMIWGIRVQSFGAYVWSGQWFFNWESINQRLFVPYNNHAPGTIFDRPSVIWTLNLDKHLIGCERAHFGWLPKKEWLATPKKVHRDLFVTRLIPYGLTAPIIQPIGYPYPVRGR